MQLLLIKKAFNFDKRLPDTLPDQVCKLFLAIDEDISNLS